MLRTGWGIFYERTPSVAGVFEQYEAPLDTRFQSDGVTPIAPPSVSIHVTDPNLRTARSVTWDAAYDHRFTTRWSAR